MLLKGLSLLTSFRTMNLLAGWLLCTAAFSQNKSGPEKKNPEAQVRTIPFGTNNSIRYDLGNGTYTIFFNGKECIKDAYAVCNATALLDSRRSWSVRRYSY